MIRLREIFRRMELAAMRKRFPGKFATDARIKSKAISSPAVRLGLNNRGIVAPNPFFKDLK